MVEEGMIVKFIGDDGNLTKSISDIEKELIGLKKQLKATTSGTEFNQLSKQVATYEAALKQASRAQAAAGGAAVKSTKDFTGLSRVIQDLPFGFLGIQNNITQLLPAAGGLGLAVSALTAGFTFASIGLQNWSGLFPSANDKIKDQVKALHDARQALSDYVELLSDKDRLNVLGGQQAQEELVNLKTLYDATQNQNIAINKRKELVDELQDQYPKYFANIKDEVILAGGAKDAYDRLTNSILASARARAGQDILVDIQKQVLAIEQKITDATNNRVKAASNLKNLQEKFLADLKKQGIAPTPGAVPGGQQQTDLNKARAEENDLLKQRNQLLDRAKNISTEIQNIIEKNPDAKLDLKGKAPKTDKFETNFFDKFFSFDPTKVQEKSKQFADAWSTFTEFAFKNLNTFVGLEEILRIDSKTSAIKEAAKWWDQFQKGLVRLRLQPLDALTEMPAVKDIFGKAGPKGRVLEMPFEIRLKMQGFEDAKKKIEDFQKSVAAALQAAQQNLAVGLGQGIGDLLSGQGISSLFKNIASVIGDFISQLGQMLIKASIAAIAFKKAFAALLANPVAAVAVGVGLVAIGQVIKNLALPKARGFADGGLVFGSTFANIGEGRGTSRANPEVVAPLDKLMGMIGGGSQTQVFIPALEASYDKWRIVFNRAENHGRLVR